MADIEIRRARKADAEQVTRIHLAACRFYAELDNTAFQVPSENGLVEWFARVLDESDPERELSIAALVDDDVVGYLEARIEGPSEGGEHQMLRELTEKRLYLNYLAIDRSVWRKGIGAALVRAAEAWGRERGASTMTTDTYIGSPVSVPFYEQGLGFQRHAVVLKKRL